MTHRRTPIFPSSTIAFIRSTSANDEPASWNVVMPLADDLCDASSSILRPRARLSSAVGVGSPTPRRIRPDAARAAARSASRSRRSGVSPPAGFGVVLGCRTAPSPGVGKAGVAARVREDDRVVRRHLVERRVGRETLDVRTGWTSISPGASRGRRSTDRAWRSSRPRPPSPRSRPSWSLHQVQLELAVPDAGEVAVALDEPGNGQLPLQVDDLRCRARRSA